MANSKSELGVGHLVVDLSDKENIMEALQCLHNMDNDLVENEEYFREDTISLGYDTESHRVIDEATKGITFPISATKFEEVANKVFDVVADQDYYGSCEISIVPIGGNKVSFVYVYGGN